MPYTKDENGILGEYVLPETGNTVVFSFRIDEGVYEDIRKIAKREGRSINAQILRFVESGVSTYMNCNLIL